MRGLPVTKDLLVHMSKFFQNFEAITPYLITHIQKHLRDRLQMLERFGNATKCILCAACTTACPPFWTNKSYYGPAAIVNAHRFIFDSRDEAAEERLDILNSGDGVWRCRPVFNCTEACPRGIDVTGAIQEVKRALLFRKL